MIKRTSYIINEFFIRNTRCDNSYVYPSLSSQTGHRVQLILDRPVAEWVRIGCHPCINTSTLNLSMAEIRNKFLPYLGVEPILVELPEEREEVH